MNLTTNKIDGGKNPTLLDIETDLINGEWEALYFATEQQIHSLIEQGRIDDGFYSHHQDYQEELRMMCASI